MGERLNSTEIFGAWLVQALKWGFPTAAAYGAVMAALIGAFGEANPAWDAGPFWTMVIGIGVAVSAAVPIMTVGGVVAGLTAIVVTRAVVPIEDSNRYSRQVRLVAGITTALVVVVLGIAIVIRAGGDMSEATAAELALVFGPLALTVFAAVWLAGRGAVERTLPPGAGGDADATEAAR